MTNQSTSHHKAVGSSSSGAQIPESPPTRSATKNPKTQNVGTQNTKTQNVRTQNVGTQNTETQNTGTQKYGSVETGEEEKELKSEKTWHLFLALVSICLIHMGKCRCYWLAARSGLL